MVLRFVGALVRHWFSLAGGAVVAVALLVWQQFGGPTIPASIVATFLGLGVLVAAFFAWEDERRRADDAESALRALRQGRPEASTEIVLDDIYLCLQVRNTGAQGMFRATIETEDGVRGLRPVPALWEQTMSSDPFEIGPGLSARLRVATLSEDRRTNIDDEGNEEPYTYGWSLLFSRPAGHRGWSGGRAPLEDATREWFTVRVVVTSNPEMQSGRTIKRLRFVARDAIDLDSGERHRPRLVVHEDEYE